MNIKGILICSVFSWLAFGSAVANEKQCVAILAAEQGDTEPQEGSNKGLDPVKLCRCIYTQSTASPKVQAEIITSDGLPERTKRTEALNNIIAQCQKTQTTK